MASRSLFVLFVVSFLAIASASSVAQGKHVRDFHHAFRVLQDAKRFQEFLTLVKSSKLQYELKKLDEFTLFVPNDEAFLDAPEIEKDKLLEVLEFHVLPKYHNFTELSKLDFPVSTLASRNFAGFAIPEIDGDFIGTEDSFALIVGTLFDRADSIAVYEIDHVLLPQEFYQDDCSADAPAPDRWAPGVSPDFKDAPAQARAIPAPATGGSTNPRILLSLPLLAALLAFLLV